MTRVITIAEAGEALSEVIERAAATGERILISREGKPIAAIVSAEELKRLDYQKHEPQPGTLAEVAGQWEHFEEVEPYIEEVYQARQKEADRG